MITWLQIENFKALHHTSIKPAALNLFFGMNGMGKSSVLQSLLLLRQSAEAGYILKGLILNGKLITGLGRGRDVFYQNAAQDDCLKIGLQFNHTKNAAFSYTFESAADILPLHKITVSEDTLYDITFSPAGKIKQSFYGHCSVRNTEMDKVFNSFMEKIREEALFSCAFQYLSAERQGPLEVYKTLGTEEQEINRLGSRGEFTPQYLSAYGNSEKIIFENIKHPKAKSDTLIDQTAAWLGEISPGIRLNTEELSNVNLVKMSIQFQTGNRISGAFSPINVGFGIPYILPVITALLRAGPGDMVCIENPESHLHPKGQSAIGRLMALAAANGVQIFCESHSDHIINGIRVAVKEKLVKNDKVGIFYFYRSQENEKGACVRQIKTDANGEMDSYPDGFLDEWGNLMSKLL